MLILERIKALSSSGFGGYGLRTKTDQKKEF